MSESFSQSEIDALMNHDTSQQNVDEQVKVDIIGEVGNISMSQAATTL